MVLVSILCILSARKLSEGSELTRLIQYSPLKTTPASLILSLTPQLSASLPSPSPLPPLKYYNTTIATSWHTKIKQRLLVVSCKFSSSLLSSYCPLFYIPSYSCLLIWPLLPTLRRCCGHPDLRTSQQQLRLIQSTELSISTCNILKHR